MTRLRIFLSRLGALVGVRVYREGRSFMWLEDVARDLRHGLRTLRKSPAFTIAAAATLALAIGANTAMFSVLNAVLLRPLPYRSPEQLAMLWTEDPTENLREGRSALWDVEEWRRQSQSFADMATFDAVSRTLTGTDGAEQIVGASISPNLLALLGIHPAQGRGFSIDEADERQRLVLISHRFWQARFAGSHDALGATIVLDGLPSQIIGILPAEFQVAGLDADVWEPHPSRQSVRGAQVWFVMGRLRPAVTFEQAQAEMSAIARRLTNQLPAAERNHAIGVVPLSLYMVGPQSRLALWMLGGAVFGVFLIAAANVTSLSLARSVARAREMAVRAALGASAGRIVRQLLTENVLLAAGSGLLGTGLASVGIRLIRAFGPGNLPRLNEVSLDLRVLVWAWGITLTAGIVVGLAASMTAWRRDLRPSGAEGGRNVSGGAATQRIRRALVVAEFALAIMLLVGAGLLLRSWWNVTSIDLAFRPERVLIMQVSTPTTLHAATLREAASASAQRIDLYQRVLEQIRAVPGVESAGIGDLFIANTREQDLTVERDGGMVSERLLFTRDEVSADFFTTLGTPLLRGRFFANGDRSGAARVAIINDAMARRAWPGRDPLGSRFKWGRQESDGPWYTVVGVVADMRRQGQEREPVPQIFESLAQNPPQRAGLFIRTSSANPLAMAGALRAAVHRVEKEAPIYGVTLLEQQLGGYLAQRRFQTSLLAGFSIVALLMAAVGIYGLIQYSIATRTQEIGLRMALGAHAGDIFRMIVGEGLRLSLAGLALGLAGAWWLGRAGSSLLFGVTASDPLTFTTVSLLLTTVATAACYFPARRAMAVDPMLALRDQAAESMWQAARQKVERAVRHLSREDERPVVPLGTLISEFADSVRRAGSVRDAADASLATLQERTGASSIMLIEKAGGEYRSRTCSIPAQGLLLNLLRQYPHPFALSEGHFATWQRWARESRPEHVAEIDALASTGVQTVVPLRTKDELVGVLLLGPPTDREQYTTAERQVLSNSGEVFALILQNARLTDRAVEQEKVRRDLAMAAEVQRRLLRPQAPRSAAATFAAFTLPARTIGGDYYDFLDLGGEQVGIAVADVSGKGISAALVMSVVQASLRVISSQRNLSLSQVAAQMNGFLYQSTDANKYATFFYAQVDERGRRLRYVNAGHNPPYLVRRADGVTEIVELGAGGTVLGLFPQVEYQEADIELRAGDLLVAYTDGVTDALNSAGDEFGEERLKEMLRAAVGAPAGEVSERLANTMRDWMGTAEQHDDLTFVVVAMKTAP